jgi:sRNA-binding protein
MPREFYYENLAKYEALITKDKHKALYMYEDEEAGRTGSIANNDGDTAMDAINKGKQHCINYQKKMNQKGDCILVAVDDKVYIPYEHFGIQRYTASGPGPLDAMRSLSSTLTTVHGVIAQNKMVDLQQQQVDAQQQMALQQAQQAQQLQQQLAQQQANAQALAQAQAIAQAQAAQAAASRSASSQIQQPISTPAPQLPTQPVQQPTRKVAQQPTAQPRKNQPAPAPQPASYTHTDDYVLEEDPTAQRHSFDQSSYMQSTSYRVHVTNTGSQNIMCSGTAKGIVAGDTFGGSSSITRQGSNSSNALVRPGQTAVVVKLNRAVRNSGGYTVSCQTTNL